MNRSAHGLASLGRNGDTMLVHMNPLEVASLQSLAQANGTSMTVNPRTGLPEAFNLKSLLPTIAGGLSMLIPGMQPIGAALLGGATGALTGDKDMPLAARFGLGALGGWGGAGIGNAFSELGKNAALEASNAAAQSVYQGAGQNLLGNLAGTSVNDITKQAIGAGLAGNSAGAAANVLAPTSAGNLAREAFMKAMPMGKYGLAAAAAPMIGEAAMPPKYEPPPEEKFKYYTTSYNPGDVNANFGQPGQSYFSGQGYGDMVEHEIDPNKKYNMADGGQVSGNDFYIAPMNIGMADGGQVPPPATPGMSPSDMMSPQRSAIDSYISNLNSKLTAPPMITPRPAPVAPSNPNAPNRMGVGYDPTTQSFTGSDAGMGRFGGMGPFGNYDGIFGEARRNLENKANMAQRASGGLTSLGGYSEGGYAGGRLLKGPGDGVSDDIPAVIDHGDGKEQPARLARGEYVIDAQTVAKLGNGSTEAGAEAIDEMVKRIHAIPTRPGKDLKAKRHMPA